MSLTPEIQEIINRLQQELNQLKQNTEEGIDLVRIPLSQFPENTVLVQLFAYLNNVLFFIRTYQARITLIIESFALTEVKNEELQEVGEELSTMLGVILETKIRVENIVNRLRN